MDTILRLENLGALPLHRICYFLNAKDLCNLAQCSKTLYNSVNCNIFWKKNCIEKNWDRFGEINDSNTSYIEHALLSNVSRYYAVNFKHDSEDLLDLLPVCFWGQVYRHVDRLKHNWQVGKYTVQSIYINSFSGDNITSVCSNSKILAVSTSNNKLLLYELYSFIFISELQHHQQITCISLMFDHVAIGLDNGIILLAKTSNLLSQFELISETCSVESMQCIGDYICGIHSNNHICVCSYSRKSFLFTLTGHSDDVFCYASFGEKWLVTGGWDCTTILWDVENGFSAVTFTGHNEAVSCIKIEGKYIVTGSFDGTVRIWNWEIAVSINVLMASKEIYCLELTTSQIIAGGSDSHIYVWQWNGDLLFKLSGHLGIVRHIKYLGDDKLISAGDMRRIMIWDIENGRCLNVLHRNPCQIGKILFNDFCVIVASDCANSHFFVLSFL